MTVSKRIGVDVDGVLADFNASFIDLFIDVTGKDLFPKRPFDIPTWHYPQHFGYTEQEADFNNGPVWKAVKEDHYFWYKLGQYSTTAQDLAVLGSLQYFQGAEIYFITNRAGVAVKRQTEMWLDEHFSGAFRPSNTVLISSAKGDVAKALKLDLYVDDNVDNCLDVKTKVPSCRVYVFDRPWNRDIEPKDGSDRSQRLADAGVVRVTAVQTALYALATTGRA